MRIFSCGSCGHRMRWTGDQCGKCYEPKPIWKLPILYNIAGFFAILGLCGAVALMALS